jgi:putative membrane protein
VSQGGLYEVEAGKVAASRGTTPFIRNFGLLDVHDHMGVNSELHKIAAQSGVAIQPGLNAEFSARLQKLKSTPANQFDSFYLDDMKKIHNGDEALFVDEAKNGTDSYKNFAHSTAVLVKAHLGWLNTQ